MIASAQTAPFRVDWATHERQWRHRWRPGQHVTIIAPTRWGKTVLARRLLRVAERGALMIVDCKGDDAELQIGEVVDHYPSRAEAQRLEDDKRPQIWRLVVPEYHFGDLAGVAKARLVVGDVMDRCYRDGTISVKVSSGRPIFGSWRSLPWTIVLDEATVVTDRQPPALNLSALYREIASRGGGRGVALMSLSQQPAFLPRAAYDQPSWMYLGRMQDVDRRKRLGEIGGDTRLISATVAELALHEFLAICRADPDYPLTIVRAPYGHSAA